MIKFDKPSSLRASRGSYAVVTLCCRIPEGADLDDMVNFVGDALLSQPGSIDPLEPMANFDPNSMRLRIRQQSQPSKWKP